MKAANPAELRRRLEEKLRRLDARVTRTVAMNRELRRVRRLGGMTKKLQAQFQHTIDRRSRRIDELFHVAYGLHLEWCARHDAGWPTS